MVCVVRLLENRIGTVIREKRVLMGYSQEALAELVDRSTSQIGQIERGEDYPSIEVLKKLIDILSIDPRLLFNDGAVSSKLQDSMVMMSKLGPEMQDFISDIIRLAYKKEIKESKR